MNDNHQSSIFGSQLPSEVLRSGMLVCVKPHDNLMGNELHGENGDAGFYAVIVSHNGLIKARAANILVCPVFRSESHWGGHGVPITIAGDIHLKARPDFIHAVNIYRIVDIPSQDYLLERQPVDDLIRQFSNILDHYNLQTHADGIGLSWGSIAYFNDFPYTDAIQGQGSFGVCFSTPEMIRSTGLVLAARVCSNPNKYRAHHHTVINQGGWESHIGADSLGLISVERFNQQKSRYVSITEQNAQEFALKAEGFYSALGYRINRYHYGDVSSAEPHHPNPKEPQTSRLRTPNHGN